MLPQSQRAILKERILTLRTALFVNMSDAVLRLPCSVIQALTVDETGQIWFYISKPWQHINEFERDFPARLDFFRKGVGYYLKIEGKACLVTDPEELYGIKSVIPELADNQRNGAVLMKIKMQVADYYECNFEKQPGLYQQLASQIKKWIFNLKQYPGKRYRLNPEELAGIG